MIYVRICFLISSFLIVLKGLNYLLLIFQEVHYDPKKYIKLLFNFYIKKPYNYLLYINILISFVDNIYLYGFGVLLSLVSLFINDKTVLKLKYTKRIKRFLITYLIINMFIFILSINLPYIFSIYLINPVLVVIINYLNFPLEYLIKKHYINLAKNKLKNNKDIVKIAITGSYGKTSTKNIITDILESKYLTLKTPKSFNTLMGITKTINASLNNSYQIFVVEMGAYRKKEIKEMSEFIKPNIGIITDIGYQHLETFKNIDNIISAKFELIDSLNFNDVAILNGDNELIRTKKIENVQNIIYYGLNKNNHIFATNIRVIQSITKFDIYKDNHFITTIETKLLGKHNILNIIASYALITVLKDKYKLEISIEDFKERIIQLEPTKHRLSYEKQCNIHIYDDAYNSNLVGFKNSIEVLSKTPYKKIIITPGIVDTGKMTKEINEEIANSMKYIFDEICIIESYSSKYIYDLLKETENISVFKSFKDAYAYILNKYQKEEISLLIEDDLPDNYLDRRK